MILKDSKIGDVVEIDGIKLEIKKHCLTGIYLTTCDSRVKEYNSFPGQRFNIYPDYIKHFRKLPQQDNIGTACFDSIQEVNDTINSKKFYIG